MMDPGQCAQIFDAAQVRRLHERAVRSGHMPDFLHRIAAEDLMGRMNAVLRDFRTVAVWGDCFAMTARALSSAHVIHLDWSGPHADAIAWLDALPLAPASLDAAVCLFGLERTNDIPGALTHIRQALKPDGLFLAAMLGGDTLCELREVLVTAESEATNGASPRVAPFASVRQLGTLLQRAGFALPVVDADRLTVGYRDAFALMGELRALGLSNALAGRGKAPSPRPWLTRAAALYSDAFGHEGNRIRATFEVIYLTGWAPDDSQPKPLRPGSAQARLADAVHAKPYPSES